MRTLYELLLLHLRSPGAPCPAARALARYLATLTPAERTALRQRLCSAPKR